MSQRKKIAGMLSVGVLLGSFCLWGVRNEAVSTAKEALAEKHLLDFTVKADAELERFSNSIEAMLRIIAKWGMEGELDSGGIPGLCAKFLPVLEEYKRVSGLILATGRGKEFYLAREGKAWMLELSGIDPASVDLHSVPGLAARIPVLRSSTPDYDPRSRPWFQKAAMSDPWNLKAVWTAPYRFFNKNKDGITASLGWRDDDGVDHVVAADVFLKDFIDFIASLDPGSQEHIFLAKADGTLIFPLKMEGPFQGLVERWNEDKSQSGSKGLGSGVLFFSFQGKKWRAVMRSLEKQKGQLVLGVLTPASGEGFRLRPGKAAWIFFGVIGALGLGLFLWRSIRRAF